MDDAARERFEAAYRATGKRYDVGKSCVRFRKLDDLPLALIGESIAAFGVDEFVARVQKAHPLRKRLKVKITELLKALEDARAGVEAVLAGLDETQLLAADACGAWSIKDVLAHLTACEAELVTGLARIRRGQSPGKVLYTDAEIQAQNEKWQIENRDRPLDQVLADFRGVRRQLIRQLESLGDQDLNAPRPWFQKRTIADWVQDEIVAHDREHATGLAEWRKWQGL